VTTDSIFTLTLATASPGKLVDLDQDQQFVSMIFGVNLVLVDDADRRAFEGSLEAVPFTDMWKRVAGPASDRAAGVVYQSIIKVRHWADDLSGSDVLQQLREAAGDDILSIKLNLDGYSLQSKQGRLVGTVGPAALDAPKHFVAGRHFGNEVFELGTQGTDFRPSKGINYFVGVVDVERGKVRLDLGNALSVKPAGGPPEDVGDLVLICRGDDGSKTEIADIDYTTPTDWYEKTAGIVELPPDRALSATERELIETSALCLATRRGDQLPIVSQEADGHVRADLFVARLNPGDTFTVRFWASRRGRPAARALIDLFLLKPLKLEAQQNFPVHGLTVHDRPFPTSVECDEYGIAEVAMKASDPGDRRYFYGPPPARRVHVDGQVYRVGYRLAGHPPTNPWNLLSVLVWNNFVPDEPPTWHGSTPQRSMRKIFVQYGNLYPWMTKAEDGPRLDLADYEQVARQRELIIDAITRPVSSAGYMPVTRDLSRSRKEAMLRWLTEVDDDGKPRLGVPTPEAVPEPLPAEEPVEDVRLELELGSKTVAGRRIRIAPMKDS
jgi:hypothetical protein